MIQIINNSDVLNYEVLVSKIQNYSLIIRTSNKLNEHIINQIISDNRDLIIDRAIKLDSRFEMAASRIILDINSPEYYNDLVINTCFDK